jgi:hypothetical protein
VYSKGVIHVFTYSKRLLHGLPSSVLFVYSPSFTPSFTLHPLTSTMPSGDYVALG